jgi:hypothetical protein
MITLRRFRQIERALAAAGYAEDIAWSEGLREPESAEQFAQAAVYVIANSGMNYAVAQKIFERCREALQGNRKVQKVFAHPGKAKAIEQIWKDRDQLFTDYQLSDDKLEFCQSLPWIGPTTSRHLAKDLGVDVAKPDVHLARLARRDRTTVPRMCRSLAKQTGYRLATIDTILWRACATGILDSKRYEADGWRAGFRGIPKFQH